MAFTPEGLIVVASRFVLSGSDRGHRVRPLGVTISRLPDGRIVEDCSAFDSLAPLAQLGPWRTLLAAHARLRCATLALVDGRLAGTLAAA